MLVEWGVDGLVCSPLELSALREEGLLDKLETMTPGIRPIWAVAKGQTRFTTPAQAVLAGADNLVIGSPITKPPARYEFEDGRIIEIGTPERAVELIIEEIEEVMVSVEDRVIRLLEDDGAILHEGHFKLRSGRHAADYVEKAAVTPHPMQSLELGNLIAEPFEDDDILVPLSSAMKSPRL
jgi:hypothetical protein